MEDKNVLFGGADLSTTSPKETSLGDFTLKTLQSLKNNTLLIDGAAGKKYTSAYLLDRSIKLCRFFIAKGIKKGDVVTICSENRIEFPEIMFATFIIGATIAPINLTYTERELQHSIDLVNPKVAFVSPWVIQRFMKMKNVPEIVYLGDKPITKNMISYNNDIIKKFNSSGPAINPVEVDIYNDVALILCSSGTTGLPKGVMLTQNNALVSINLQRAEKALQPNPESLVLLSIIPWFHTFGCLTMMSSCLTDVKLVFLPKFEEKSFLGAIKQNKVTMALLVPPLVVFLAKHPIVDKYDLSSLMGIFCGAAPLSTETIIAVKNRIKSLLFVLNGYGMTEGSMGLTGQSPTSIKAGSIGKIRPGLYGKIVDPETNQTLGPNQQGEMCFKGSSIMKGYLKNDDATSQTIRNGWLHTGDIGYYDNDGHWFIVDRLKELIKYKGYQVPPAEIEGILMTHPEIMDAGVVGLPDEFAGELPLAFVVKRPNSSLTEKAIIDFVAGKMSPAKRLHGGVRFVSEIPKNASGKILRRELRTRLKNKVQSKI